MDDLLSRCQEFDQAELHADVKRLEALLADDFLSIGEQGFVLDKTQWIARHADFAYLSVESLDLDVRSVIFSRAFCSRLRPRSRL